MFSYSVGHFNDAGSKESYPLRMQEASEPSKRRTFHVSILGDGSVEVTEDISGWRSHVWAKLCLFSFCMSCTCLENGNLRSLPSPSFYFNSVSSMREYFL